MRRTVTNSHSCLFVFGSCRPWFLLQTRTPMNVDDIFTYDKLVAEEHANLQKGMNFAIDGLDNEEIVVNECSLV